MWLFLAAAVGPLAKRILIALGVGLVSYASVQTLANSLISQVQSNFGMIPTSMLQIATLGGIPQALSIICGALLARVALLAVSKFARVGS